MRNSRIFGAQRGRPNPPRGPTRLEYRGYDSSGITILNGDGTLTTVKKPGKIAVLEEAMGGTPPKGHCGIAHTRWATHGGPTEANAHPHFSTDGDIALVHNGIIENADELREDLEELGYVFRSETDTEVIIHLIDEAFKGNHRLEDAVAAALLQVEGAYGIAVISSRDPGKIVAARNGSPLLLGIGKEGEYLVGSDASALVAQHQRRGLSRRRGYRRHEWRSGHWTFHLERGAVTRPIQRVTWDLGAVEKEGFDHFMLKEIFEQPSSLRDVLRGRLLAGRGRVQAGGRDHLGPGTPENQADHHHGLRDLLALGPPG